MNRETLYAALFAKFSGLAAFKTTSRRLKHWEEVGAGQQPALFQTQVKESPQTTTGLPTKWECQVKLYLYAKFDKSTGTHPLNDVMDAITNAFKRDNFTGRVTLGIPGVEWARLDGDIETDEGLLGEQAVAIIPVTVLVTD